MIKEDVRFNIDLDYQKIDNLIENLQKAKEKGATHIEVDLNVSYEYIEVDFYKEREETEEEIEELRIIQKEKEKEFRESKLQKFLELKEELGL